MYRYSKKKTFNRTGPTFCFYFLSGQLTNNLKHLTVSKVDYMKINVLITCILQGEEKCEKLTTAKFNLLCIRNIMLLYSRYRGV